VKKVLKIWLKITEIKALDLLKRVDDQTGLVVAKSDRKNR